MSKSGLYLLGKHTFFKDNVQNIQVIYSGYIFRLWSVGLAVINRCEGELVTFISCGRLAGDLSLSGVTEMR